MKEREGQSGFIGMVLVVVMTIAVIVIGLYIWSVNNRKSDNVDMPVNQGSNSQAQSNGLEYFSGQIINIDHSAMETDGDGIYIIAQGDGAEQTVYRTGGRTVINCDDRVISELDNLRENMRVEVAAEIDERGRLVVCKSGTYIRETQAR